MNEGIGYLRMYRGITIVDEDCKDPRFFAIGDYNWNINEKHML